MEKLMIHRYLTWEVAVSITCMVHLRMELRPPVGRLLNFLGQSIYCVFKNIPTRRAQLTDYSGSTVFPKKFCALRWLENDKVAAHAIEIIPNLKKMVDGLKRDKNEPTSASYKTISRAIANPLLPVKLEFFRSLAAECQPFLQEYQTDSPMAPFLHSSLVTVLKNVMNRFIKDNVMNSLSPETLSRVDLLNANNLIAPAQVDLGYGIKKPSKMQGKIRM